MKMKKSRIPKPIWFTLGMFCVGMAYIGVITPGIPFSIFLVIAAYSFARSSEKMHNWIFSHKYFGPFLTNWYQYRVFPLYAKWSMVLVMSATLVFTYWATGNLKLFLWTFAIMAAVAIWAVKYPSSKQEHDRRKKAGEKIAWLK